MPLVGSAHELHRNFNVITTGMLKFADMHNVVMMGEMVLAMMLPPPFFSTIFEYFRSPLFSNYDVELHLHGQLSATQVTQKIEGLYHAIKRTLPAAMTLLAVRTADSVTFMTDAPRRQIRVYTKVHASPIEVLLDVAVDCCAMAFDGTSVYALPRALLAIKQQMNIYHKDLTEDQSRSYETELLRVRSRVRTLTNTNTRYATCV